MSETKHEYADLYVSTLDKMPKEPHWAIIEQSSHDDGYGGTSTHVTYEAYLTEEKWLRQIQYREEQKSHRDYRAIRVNPASVDIKTVVSVK